MNKFVLYSKNKEVRRMLSLLNLNLNLNLNFTIFCANLSQNIKNLN
jgi:hypothetical protein